MKIKDMKQVVKMLQDEWNLGKKESEAEGNICAWIYLMEILEETEKFVYYRDSGKLIGLAGYSKDNSNKYFIRKKIYSFIKKQLYKSKKIKNLDGLKQYENNYNYMPEELKNDFDGELSILILDKNYRGKGIGKELLSRVFELSKNDNMKKLKIVTDESCTYQIYEKMDCKKVFETIVENKEIGKLNTILKEKAFIYEKVL